MPKYGAADLFLVTSRISNDTYLGIGGKERAYRIFYLPGEEIKSR